MLDIFSVVATAVAAGDSIPAVADGLESVKSAFAGLTYEELLQAFVSFCISFGVKIIKVLFVWVIGRWITKRLVSLAKILMEKRNTNVTVRSFVASLIDVVLLILLIVMIIGIFGIDTSSFIALFASAGVAVGMALSGTLQNFAGGVMILLFRPYKVGDYIEAQGQSGTVKEIQIFNTVLKTPDNKIILVPNGAMSTGIVNNYSAEQLRRVDFSFPISYGDDYEKAKAFIEEIIAADSRILKDPAHFIALGSLGTSSVNITVRVWTKQADYWDVYFDMNQKVYEQLPKHGLNFPYQTYNVNIKQ